MAKKNQEIQAKNEEELNHTFLPSAWEERFEREINELFDDAIDRLPRFVDRNFRSFFKVMGRNLSPKTSIGDLFVGIRNLASGISETFGGPNFETSTYTEDSISKAFEHEVLSSLELEALLTRLFEEFEEDLWRRFEEKMVRNSPEVLLFRDHLTQMIREEIAHDPKLARAVRSGIHVGIPITLGYLLFNRSKPSPFSPRDMISWGFHENPIMKKLFSSVRGKSGRFNDNFPFDDATSHALGFTGALLGSLVAGGLFEYAFNSLRDLKGGYIRQINTARYVLLYGADPSNANGRGILHIVRAIERRFDELPGFAAKAFNLWLESGIRSSNNMINHSSDDLKQISYFSGDDHGDITIEEALEINLHDSEESEGKKVTSDRQPSNQDH